MASVARRYAHKTPFILKINHNELLTLAVATLPNSFRRSGTGIDLGATAIGATIYFGSPESRRRIQEVSQALQQADELGMATILWCYLRNPAFKTKEKDHHLAADLTGQANHLGVTIKADIIKQKMPENNGGFTALKLARPTQSLH